MVETGEIHRMALKELLPSEVLVPELYSVVRVLLSRSYNEERVDEFGSIFIGRRQPGMPGEESWFHVVYPGLSESEYALLEYDLGLSVWNPKLDLSKFHASSSEKKWAFSTQYHSFLRHLNGGRFFAGHLNFFGVRRNDPWSTSQPLELAAENPFLMANNGSGKILIFGGYRWDGSLLACMENEINIVRYSRDGVALNRWSNFESFVDSEFRRLNSLFDSAGYLLETVKASIPDPE